jgi:hypothetical protein
LVAAATIAAVPFLKIFPAASFPSVVTPEDAFLVSVKLRIPPALAFRGLSFILDVI